MKNKLVKAWGSTVEFFVPYLGWMEILALAISAVMTVMYFVITLIFTKND